MDYCATAKKTWSRLKQTVLKLPRHSDRWLSLWVVGAVYTEVKVAMYRLCLLLEHGGALALGYGFWILQKKKHK